MKLPLVVRLGVLLVALVPFARAQTYSTSTFAGLAGASGSADGTGSAARFRAPTSPGIDGAGNLYVLDADRTTLRKISPAGVTTTVVPSLLGSHTLAVTSAGVVYLADSSAHVIRQVSATGTVTVFAGTAGTSGNANGTGAAARFYFPEGLTVDAAGNVYVCDTYNHTLRKITPAGVVTTVAGLAGVSGSADGPAPLARFYSPTGIAVDTAGNLFVADRGNYTVRKISAAGEVSTLAGSPGSNYYYYYSGSGDGVGNLARFGDLSGICLDASGTLFVTEKGLHTVRRVSANGAVTTLLGLPGVSGSAEGLGNESRFSAPTGVTVDAAGNLFIADSNNHTLRKATFIPLPVVTTPPAAVTANAAQSATFTFVATGGPTATYQWQRQPALGGGFVNLPNGGAYAGATTATLVVSGLSAVMHGDQFRCVVTNAAGTAFSPAAALTVISTPVFTSAATTSFTSGTAGIFAVTAAGSPAASYSFTAGSFPSWASLNTTTGVITGTPPSSTGAPFAFTLSATNSVGTATQSFVLAVPAPAVPPTVTLASGRRQVLSQGQSLALVVSASGSAPLTYQWKRNGLPIAGATAANYTITNATAADAGYYQTAVSNAAGTVTGAAIFVNVSYGATEVIGWGTALTLPAGLTTAVAVAAGNLHGLALLANGTVQAWGGDSSVAFVPAGLSEVVAISAGATHSVALKSDGTVVAWGYNYSSYAQTAVPAGLTDVVAIAAGDYFTVALKGDGTVVEWGGVAGVYSSYQPAPVGLSSVVAVAAGGANALALKLDGTVVGWGYTSGSVLPVPAAASPAAAVAVGGSAGFAVTTGGSVLAWGYSSYGLTTVPAGLTGVVAVASSSYQAVALKADGTVALWGDASSYYNPVTFPVNTRSIVAISAGGSYRLALRNASNDTAPVITASPGSTVANLGQRVTFTVGVSAGTASVAYQWLKDNVAISGATSSAYTINGVLAASVGVYRVRVSNAFGTADSQPATLTLSAAPVVSVTTGGRYPLSPGQSLTLTLAPAISAEATVQWRRNGQPLAGATGRSYAITGATSAHGGYYQAVYNDGSGPVISAAIFVPFIPTATQVLRYDYNGVETAPLAGFGQIIALSARNASITALTAAGTVVRGPAPASYYSYGDDATYVPAGLNNIVAVSAGYSFSLALRADGTVVAWGNSSSTSPTSYPVLVVPTGLTNVVAVSAGSAHALALKGDGTVMAWGSPANGATAVPVGLTNVVAVAAGDGFSLALRADGTVVGWGRNTNGESSPPAGLSGVVALAAGSSVSLALKFDGTVVAWGYSAYGLATLPAGLSAVIAIATGDSHALALKSDGTVVAWGNVSTYSSVRVTLPASLRNVIGVAGSGGGASAILRDASADTSPVIASQPVDIAALTGQAATLRVVADAGTAPLSYQWRKAGSTLANATGSTLTLLGLTPASAGTYDVVVANYLGIVTSRTLTLTVSPSVGVSVSPAGRTALATGDALTLAGTVNLTGPVTYQWRRNGRPIPGATSATYALTSARWSDGGAYQLAATNAVGPALSAPVFLSVGGNFQVRAWGDNSAGQSSVPAGLTGVVSVAAGGANSLALKNNGTVVSWGTTELGLQNVPADLTNVVAIAAGYRFSLALRADGTVATWGGINFTPSGLTDVIAIAAGPLSNYALALRSDGSVIAWTAEGVRTDTPAGLGDVVAIAGGGSTRYALRSDGTVVYWTQGDSYYGTIAPLVAGPSGVVALAAGSEYLLTLKTDGTVATLGSYSYSSVPTIPSGLNRVVALAAGGGAFALKDDGNIAVVFASSGSFATGAVAVSPALQVSAGSGHGLALRDPAGDIAPVIVTQSSAQTVSAGQSVTLAVTVTASPNPIFQWYRNGSVFSGATSSTLTLSNVSSPYSGGTYTVTVSNALGSVTSADIVLTVTPTFSERSLLRGTARANVQASSVYSSFTVEGATGKNILIRGVGPALAALGLTDLFPDPQLAVTNSTGAFVAGNDNWGSSGSSYSLYSAAASVGALPLPDGSKDAAVSRFFPPGTYHVRLSGTSDHGGVALLELFDYDSAPRLVYLSTNAFAGSGNDVFVQGFALSGAFAGRSYLIRALGPTLAGAGSLADPRLAVFGPDGVQLAANDDWAGDPALAALGASVGAMPLATGSKEAVVNFLPPSGGAFTVKVSGAPGSTGRVLLEIFEIDAQRAALTPVAIVAPPQAFTAVAGQPASFGVATVGKPAPTYQWRKNGTAITGATGATLTLASVQSGDVGDYSVVATNADGTATSPVAPLTLVTQLATHTVVGHGYVAGSIVTLTNTLTYSGSATSLGWLLTLPAGWSYASGGGSAGDVKPAVGATGTIEWAWTTPVASPVTFTATLNVPAGETAGRTLTASAIVRTGTTPQTTPVAPGNLLIEPAPPNHSADTDHNLSVSLIELTRVIELYNTRNGSARTGAYAVATTTTEDGFVPVATRAAGATATLATYHTADSDRDGRLSLLELTRVIELYNTRSGTSRTGAYRVQGGTEDGFAPGP